MRTGLRLLASIMLALAALAGAMLPSASPVFAQQQKRVAFVIGNGGYQNVPRLPNALNDATATAAMLREAGFEVVAATDATLGGLRESLDSFIGRVERAGAGATALVYYAGHAIQLDGANYLLPVDIRTESAANIARQSLSLSDILKRLDATGAVAKIAILDACRDNPFAAREFSRGLALQMVDGALEAPRSEAGLARIDSRSGTFVAFATSPGATAADGAGSNSPFTEAFLRLAREPGQPVEQLFRRIRLAVHDATSGSQIPWDTSSLISDFAFFQRPAAPVAPPAAGAPSDPVSLTTRPTAASLRALSPADAYRAAIAWDRRDIYRSVLELQPEGERAPRLHRIVALRTEETAWAETVRAGDAESFQLYARLFPGSTHLAEATRLAQTAPSRNRAQVAQTCPVCPALQPRARRAAYTPRSPRRPGAPRQPQAAPPPPPVYVPPLPAILPDRPRWTGFYVGGSVGGGRQTDRTNVAGPFGSPTVTPTTTTSTTTTTTQEVDLGSTTQTVTTTTTSTTTVAGTPTLAPWAINPAAVPRSLAPEGAGAAGGAQFGFNYQIGAVVIGAESDISATSLGSSKNVSANPGTRFTTRVSSDLSMLGTVRVRAGIALGDFLIYGSGGYAYGLVDQKGSITPDNLQTTSAASGSRSGVLSGWALGGGIEYAIVPGMTVRLDYTHYELGGKRMLLQDSTGLAPGQYATMRIRTAGDIVKAGFNFGF
jgi:uncharacterized caspase-like protein